MKPAQCHKRITATYYSACAISQLHHAIVELHACPVGGNLDAYAYTASNKKPTDQRDSEPSLVPSPC